MQTISTHQAKTHLSRYLAAVETGREIVIARGSKPVARLIPYARPAAAKRPKVGQIMGKKFSIPSAALSPLTDRELKAWGL